MPVVITLDEYKKFNGAGPVFVPPGTKCSKCGTLSLTSPFMGATEEGILRFYGAADSKQLSAYKTFRLIGAESSRLVKSYLTIRYFTIHPPPKTSSPR